MDKHTAHFLELIINRLHDGQKDAALTQSLMFLFQQLKGSGFLLFPAEYQAEYIFLSKSPREENLTTTAINHFLELFQKFNLYLIECSSNCNFVIIVFKIFCFVFSSFSLGLRMGSQQDNSIKKQPNTRKMCFKKKGR